MWRTRWEHVVYTNFVFVLTFRTIYVHNMFSPCTELGIFMYWTCNSMNNLSSYCWLVDAKIGASDKDLPVITTFQTRWQMTKIKYIPNCSPYKTATINLNCKYPYNWTTFVPPSLSNSTNMGCICCKYHRPKLIF